MTQVKAQEIKNILDQRLRHEQLQAYGNVDEEAAALFKQIFAEKLGFSRQPGIPGDSIPTDDWRSDALAEDAYLLAQDFDSDVRVIYAVIGKMTRTAQRFFIDSLISHKWAQRGNTIVIFHSSDSDVWHLVTAFDNEDSGRLVLQRFVAGVGENHRTLAENLSYMDANLDQPLYDRVREAFSVQTITEDFYDRYKERFHQLKAELYQEVNAKEAKEYAHLLLNRLMFLYFLQKKRWLNDRKDFMRWFMERYEESDDEEAFHSKWLTTLFFNAMSEPQGNKHIDVDLPGDVKSALESFPHFNGGLFERHAVDDKVEERTATVSDAMMQEIINDFLEGYNFTVTEESPFDIDMAVDPAMLGKIYESLIAEEERGKAGIFYTPRVEVDLMCRLGLLEYLTREDGEPAESAGVSSDDIIEFLFTSLEDWDKNKSDQFLSLKPLLDQVTVCDPACGSGAFLVGMLQVLRELYSKLGVSVDYGLKEDIIQRSIHGADIKDWAIRMAEFRLWLALIESETELPLDEPVLPNFTFNLRCGDSIVQKMGDEHVKLNLRPKYVNKKIHNEIEELKDLQKRHYLGESELESAITKKQAELLIKLIDRKIEDLKTDRHGIQQTLDGKLSDQSQDRYNAISEQIESLEEQKHEINSGNAQRRFIWGLDFLGPMIEGGFDVVIANPPYIGSDRIVNPNYEAEELAMLSTNEQSEINKAYRTELQQYVKNIWADNISKKCNIYIHFFFRGVQLCSEGGAFVYISSNSWLDSVYGKYLQRFLLKLTNLNYVVENQHERSFEEADVNTAITVGKRKSNSTYNVLNETTAFLNITTPFNSIGTSQIVTELLDRDEYDYSVPYQDQTLGIRKRPSHRCVLVDAKTLWRVGGGEIAASSSNAMLASGDYERDKWGSKFIKAPDIYYTLLKRGKNMLEKMNKYFNGERYLNTGGADNFFILSKVSETEDSNFYHVRNEKVTDDNLEPFDGYINSKFLRPLIKDYPQQAKMIKIDGHDAFCVVVEGSDIEGVESYLQWGEKQGYHRRSGTIDRHPWYKPTVQMRNGAEFLLPRSFNDSFVIYYNPEKYLSLRYFRLHRKHGDAEQLAAFLNSTVTAFFLEIIGNRSLGLGALDVSKEDFENLTLPVVLTDDLKEPFQSLSYREIASVFEECGFYLCDNPDCNHAEHPYELVEPENFALSSVWTDRRNLDKIILDTIGLTEDEQIEMYKELIRLVKERLMKARSV